VRCPRAPSSYLSVRELAELLLSLLDFRLRYLQGEEKDDHRPHFGEGQNPTNNILLLPFKSF